MTLQECYAALEGDYQEVLGRLYSEALVQKFVGKFLSDKSFQLLQDTLKAEDYEEAFRAAHTLKGTKDYDLALQLLPKVEGDYTRTAEAIQAYQGG